MEKPFILLIMNCYKYRDKALNQKNTWLKTLPSNIQYYHVIGDINKCDTKSFIIDEDEHILYVPTKDDYNSLPSKVITAYDVIYNNFNYKYIFKTDDDQILIKPDFFKQITEYLLIKQPIVYYGGFSMSIKRTTSTYYVEHPCLPKDLVLEETIYCNGRFYLLHQEAIANLLIKKDDISKKYFEDHSIGYYLDDKYKKNLFHLNSQDFFSDHEIRSNISFKGFYINLDHRTDRKEHFENLKTNFPFLKNIQRLSAIHETNGAIGCGKSHILALEKCLEYDDDVFMICEDDLLISNNNNFISFINTIDINADWDILTLTPRGDIIPNQELPNNYIRINNNQTTTGYIIKRNMIPILIINLKEAINGLTQDGKGLIYSIDQYWKRLQNDYKFYYYKYIFAGQLVGYSDIEKKNVNYNERYSIQ
jgi:GR25 family glycosyltransferase involved in LPS biosynthesis